jgi:hypothetical protein
MALADPTFVATAAVNVALLDPAPIVTEDGTVTLLNVLESATAAAVCAGKLNVTVQSAEAPGDTVVGEHEMLVRVGPPVVPVSTVAVKATGSSPFTSAIT